MSDEEEIIELKNQIICLKVDLEEVNNKYIREKVAKEEIEELLENSVSKDVIREKIEELEKYIYTGENVPQDFLQYRVKAKIQGYKELLGE